jgi:hypothetical protein
MKVIVEECYKLEIEKFLLSYDSLFLTKMPREIF